MKSELLSILKSLTPKELKELAQFLSVPFSCHNKNSRKLFEGILKFCPDFIITDQDKFVLYKSIYGESPFNASTFRSLFHSLQASIEDFLILEDIRNEPVGRSVRLLEVMSKRNASSNIEKRIPFLPNNYFHQGSKFNSELLLNIYKLEIIRYNNSKQSGVKNMSHLVEKIERMREANLALLLFYFVETVSIVVNLEIHKSKYNVKTVSDENLIESLNIKKLSGFFSGTDYYIYFMLYDSMLKLFASPENDVNFSLYRDYVKETANKLESFELAQHYSALISYCIRKKNGEKSLFFKRQLWSIYEELLSSDLHFGYKNKIDIYMFRSIVFLGLDLGFFEKVKECIESNFKKVQFSEQENMYNFGFAHYFHSMNQLELALYYATKISLSDFIFKYDVKNLLIKIYYELGYFDSVSSVIHTYREFLRNDQLLNDKTKASFKMFLHYADKLLQLDIDRSDIERGYQMKRLVSEPLIYSKDWLLEQFTKKKGHT